jgi:hypothetical protein
VRELSKRALGRPSPGSLRLGAAWLAGWLALWAVALPLRVHADEPDSLDAKLELTAGASCLQRGLLLERLRFWLADFPVRSDFAIQVHGSADAPRDVEVVLRDAAGNLSRRTFSPGPERCADLHDAAGLAAVLLIKAASGADAPGDAAPGMKGEPPADSGVPWVPPPAHPAAASRSPASSPAEPAQHPPIFRDLSLAAAAGPAFLGGTLAGSLRLTLSLALFQRLRFAAGATAFWNERQALGDAGGHYRTRTWAGSLEVCSLVGPPRRETWLGELCAGVLAGRLRAEGEGFDLALESKLRFVAASLGPQLFWRATPWMALGASLSLLIPLQPIRIASATGEGQLKSEKLWPNAGLALGVGARFRLAARDP